MLTKCNFSLACLFWAECRDILIFFNSDICLPLSSCKLTSPSCLHLLFRAPEILKAISCDKHLAYLFWKFSWIINQLVGTIRKLLLILIFINSFKVLCTRFCKWTISKMFFVTRERAHSRNQLQKGSCFLQISAFHACYFCSRVCLLARDISQISTKRDSQHRELQRGPSSSLSPASARRASNCAI